MSSLRSTRLSSILSSPGKIFSEGRLNDLDSDSPVEIENFSKAEEADGKLEFTEMDDKLMHSVIDCDQEKIADGKMIEESINQGMSTFTPDLMFEQMVKNYSLAKQIYGDSLLRYASGYNPEYIEKNIHIPEFQRELKKRLDEHANQLKKDKLIGKHNELTEKGLELASLVMYVEELDNIIPKGLSGDRIHKKFNIYGDRSEIKTYKKGDRYSDIAIRKSLKTAVRRGHESLALDDLRSFERSSKGECYILYGIDASGSMKGRKVSTCKRAGIALSFNAIREKDKVGLLVFGTEVRDVVAPTRDFTQLLKAITGVRAEAETDLSATIRKAVEVFPNEDVTKHLLLLTDALPTKGDKPEEDALEAASLARSAGVTISIIGINLDEKGKSLAEQLVGIGRGRLYVVKDLDEIDKLVLMDYHSVY